MDVSTVADIVTNLGALGILGVYFLYTQPKMMSEQLATFKEIVQEFRTITKEQDERFHDRVKEATEALDNVCRYRG